MLDILIISSKFLNCKLNPFILFPLNNLILGVNVRSLLFFLKKMYHISHPHLQKILSSLMHPRGLLKMLFKKGSRLLYQQGKVIIPQLWLIKLLRPQINYRYMCFIYWHNWQYGPFVLAFVLNFNQKVSSDWRFFSDIASQRNKNQFLRITYFSLDSSEEKPAHLWNKSAVNLQAIVSHKSLGRPDRESCPGFNDLMTNQRLGQLFLGVIYM